jgi:hypothetical protein
MEKYHGFESWLKTKKYKTWNTYLSFMRQIEKDLGNIALEKITSIAYLKKLLIELENKSVFMSRSESDKSNILSGFRTYIDYIQEKKELKL